MQTRTKSSWWWALSSSRSLLCRLPFVGRAESVSAPGQGVRASSWEDGAAGSCPWAEEGVDCDLHASVVNVQGT